MKEAKRDAGIPRAQHPESINRVEMRTAPHEGSRVIKDKMVRSYGRGSTLSLIIKGKDYHTRS